MKRVFGLVFLIISLCILLIAYEGTSLDADELEKSTQIQIFSKELIYEDSKEGRIDNLPFVLGDAYFYAILMLGFDEWSDEFRKFDGEHRLYYESDSIKLYADERTLLRKIVVLTGTYWGIEIGRTSREEVMEILPSDSTDDTVTYSISNEITLSIGYFEDIVSYISLETASNEMKLPDITGEIISTVQADLNNRNIGKYSFLYDYPIVDIVDEIRNRFGKEPLMVDGSIFIYDTFKLYFVVYAEYRGDYWRGILPDISRLARLDLLEGAEIWGIKIGESTVDDIFTLFGTPDHVLYAWPYRYCFDGEIFARGRKNEFAFQYSFPYSYINIYFANGKVNAMRIAIPYIETLHVRVGREFVQIPTDGRQPRVDGHTLAPLRVVMEALGFEVEWVSAQNQANLTKPEFDISLTIGSQTMIVNGNYISLNVPPQLINGRTMVPLRVISEVTGMEVTWVQPVY